MHAKPTIILDEIHTQTFSKKIIKEKLFNKINNLEIKINKIETSLNNFHEINQINSKKETLNESEFLSNQFNKEEMFIRIERLERNVLKNSNLDTINRKNDYKTPIKEILETTSLQFLLSPIRSKRFLIKIINSSFLILSMCLTIYLLVSNIIEYLMYETITSIKTINDKKPQFPIVSFCSIENSSHEEFFTEFWFNDELLTSDWKNYFEAFQDSSYIGKCYRFNSGINMSNHSVPIQKSKRSGYNDAFILKYKSDANFFIISIYNQTQNPSTIYNKGFYTSTGNGPYFSIKRIYDTQLEYPYNDCLNDVSKFTMNKTIINYMQNKSSQYSEKECIRLCENLKYQEESNCNHSLKNLDDYPYKVCYNNIELITCYKKFMEYFNAKEDIICSQYCPLECDTFSYDISINSRTSQSLLSENTTHISVFYEEFKYTLIYQQPKMQIIDLISNIGGSLGLFVGISFISFLELFEILIEIIFIYFGK